MKVRSFVVAMILAAAAGLYPHQGQADGSPVVTAAETPRRIISLIPAVTEMIFAMGDGARIVGVSNYDRFPPEVERIKKVGGLLDPDVEGIIALKPDLVIVYATQKELIQRLDRAHIPYFNYEHRALPDIITTIRAVGTRIGSAARGDAVALEMERSLAAIRASTSPCPSNHHAGVRPRSVDAANVYASGGYGSFTTCSKSPAVAMCSKTSSGSRCRRAPRMILTRRPDVIIDLKYGDSAKTIDIPRELEAWSALASVPAVKNRRVTILVGDEFVVPGPRVVVGTRKLAATLHPETIR